MNRHASVARLSGVASRVAFQGSALTSPSAPCLDHPLVLSHGPDILAGVDYQSLYRRFRPQRFDELKGQEHVATALRNAVRDAKVTHAYLFSGPRGTGKTSTARILAKALNCTALEGGEPCGVCASCLMVAAGTSMDVTELDAASHNGVDAMRDLVARASLGTSGRHRVFIVDEVHMLSTAAANALLKTLEEPPSHVVFVLATTDPQKVLPTIQSRTQHFEFRLLATTLLHEHLRWVAVEAGIELDDASLEEVARRGRGSARDALSALDQVAAAGGVDDRTESVGEIVSALIARDAGAALAAVAEASERGREARQLARDLVEQLRQIFLAVMAPRLVTPDPVVSTWAASASPAALTRAMEVLGEALVDQREALDPRLTLEVALVRLARPELDTSPAALVERIERMERSGTLPPPPVRLVAPTPPAAPSPRREGAAPEASDGPAPRPPEGQPALPASIPAPPLRPDAESLRPATGSPPGRDANGGRRGVADAARAALGGGRSSAAAARPAALATPRHGEVASTPPVEPTSTSTDPWERTLEALTRGTRALFASGRAVFGHDGPATIVTVSVATEPHRVRCEAKLAEVEAAAAAAVGGPVTVCVNVGEVGGDEPPRRDEAIPLVQTDRRIVARANAPTVGPGDQYDDEHASIDVRELEDAPPAQVVSGLDLVLKAFGPKTVVVEER